MEANSKQIGGDHYKAVIEPWDAIEAWGLGYFDGNAVKYLSRWRKKGGIQDLEKAIHYIQKLIENERLRRTHNQAQANPEDGAKPKAKELTHPSSCSSFAYDTGGTAISGFPAERRYEGYGQPRTLRDIL